MWKLKGTNVATKNSQKLEHQPNFEMWLIFFFKQAVYVEKTENPNFLMIAVL